MIQFDEHIFQMGWNHHSRNDGSKSSDSPKSSKIPFKGGVWNTLLPTFSGVCVFFLKGGPNTYTVAR